MNSELILTRIQDEVAVLTMNRPEKFNSFNREMALALQKALDINSRTPEVRCIVLTAQGKAFCAGQDLGEAMDPNGPGITKIVNEHYNPLITRLRSVPVPVICAVNGVAAGAGANIALAGDIVVAARSASFIQAFSKIGLVPDSGGTWTLPRLIGYQRASALMMLGDKLSADDAWQMGMLYKVYDDAQFMDEVMKLAVRVAAMPTRALILTRDLLKSSASNTLEEQLKLEGVYQTEAASTADYTEGVNAFLEKRQAAFKGV
jgi:2-(1,2-epoxy-1,2-dihydrophenyl)acetyl-CoA isomerase